MITALPNKFSKRSYLLLLQFASRRRL